MAEAGDGSAHTPLTPEWTPAPRASHYPWQGDRPAAAPLLYSVSQKNPPPCCFLTFFPNGWEFLISFLHTYYAFLSMLDYKFLFKHFQL